MLRSIAIILFAAATTSAATVPATARCAPTLGILENLTLLGVTDHNAGFRWDLVTPRSSPVHEVFFALELRYGAGYSERYRFYPATDRFVHTLDDLLPNEWYMFRVQAIHIKEGRCRVSSNIIWTSFKTLKRGSTLFPSRFAPLLTEKIHQRHKRESQLIFFAEKQGNEIVLEHDFRIFPTGELNYYELLVSEKDSRVDMLELEYIPRLIGDIYKITPQKKERSSWPDTRAEYAEALRKSLFGHWRPEIAMDIVLLKQTRASIRFAIVFAPPYVTMDEIEGSLEYWEAPRLRLTSGLADLLHFARYEEILFRIRRCVSYSWKAFDSCGHASDFSLLSNVGGPSQVLYPELYLTGDILRVSWEKPMVLRGPIDGYVVSIRTTVEGRNETQVVHVKHTETYYEIPKYSRDLAYNIGIAAFNFDSENATLEHTGDWVFILPPNSWLFHYKQPLTILLIIVMIFGLVIGSTCLFWEAVWRYRRNRNEIPPLEHQE